MSLQNHQMLSQAMSASILAQSQGLDPRSIPQQFLPSHLRLGPSNFDASILARAQFAQAQNMRIPNMSQLGLQQPTLGGQIDPMIAAQYGYAQLLHGAGTRKNATRESTAPLKSWLKDHQKNPYPTKGEKIMLALVSGMTLTQVSTWFANARRRLKKENKWSPDAGFEDDEESKTNTVTTLALEPSELHRAEESGYSSHNDGSNSEHNSEHSSPRSQNLTPPPQIISRGVIRQNLTPVITKGPALQSTPHNRPKIWSLAEMTSSSNGSDNGSETDYNPIQVS